MTRERYGSAVAVGGGIGGSMAARVLSDHFERVTVLEEDVFPDSAEQRRGVPQGNHIHGLLSRGRSVLDTYYPGFTEEAVGRTAHLVKQTSEIRDHRRYGWAPRFESPLRVLLLSRPLLELIIRSRTMQISNVTYRGSHKVLDLVSEDGETVTGVRYRNAAGENAEMRADLVVDASGRRSDASKWLKNLGYEPPETVTVDGRWSYSSCFVRTSPGWDPGWKATTAHPIGSVTEGPRRFRGASMLRQDGERRWIITLWGSGGERPPGDPAGFFDYLRSVGYLDEAIPHVELLNEPAAWSATANRLRRFELMKSRPENFVLLGDAVAAFNPVYGQGMTMAMVGAVDLETELVEQRKRGADGLHGLAGRFQSRLAESSQLPWKLSTGGDFRVARLAGFAETPQDPKDAALQAYMDRIDALSSEDDELKLKLLETLHLVRDPGWLTDDEDLRQRVTADWDRLGKMVGV